MNFEIKITDVNPDDNLLLAKFADLLAKRNAILPELTREPTRRLVVMYPEAKDKVDRIREILDEEYGIN